MGLALGYLDGRIAYTNAALAKLAGLTHDQIRNLSFFDLLDTFRTDVFDEPAIAVRRVCRPAKPMNASFIFQTEMRLMGCASRLYWTIQ